MNTCRRVLLVTMILYTQTAAASNWRLTEFEPAANALSWQIVNDTVMGGRSSSRYTLNNNRLQFTGVLSTNGGGFASLRSSRIPWDLGGCDRFRLKVKGDGRTYRFRVFALEDRASYQSAFKTKTDEWTIVELPIDTFYASWRGRRLSRPPLNPADIAGFGFIVADGVDGPFRLEVDWIEVDIVAAPDRR